jgi:hypothetical protein
VKGGYGEDADQRGRAGRGITMSSYEPITERDIETPVEDLIEQARTDDPDDEADDRATAPIDDPEINEADAAEQRIEVRSSDDEEYRG